MISFECVNRYPTQPDSSLTHLSEHGDFMASRHTRAHASRCRVVKPDGCLMLRYRESHGRSQFNARDWRFNRVMAQ